MSYNPLTWAMNAVSSPVAKKRKVDDISESATKDTLELIMGEINELKKSNERIENLLKLLTREAKVEGEEGKKEQEEEEESESHDKEEEEVDPEGVLSKSWLNRFEELKKFKAKHGHCRVTKDDKKPELSKWIVRQRSEKKTGKMRHLEVKLAKLDSVGFDWTPKTQTPAKSPAKKRRR